MKYLLRLLKPYLGVIAVLAGLVVVQVWSMLALPDYMARIIDQGIIPTNTHLVLVTGGTMLLVSLAGGLAMIGVTFLASQTAAAFARDVRTKVFAKVENFSLAELNKFSTATLITRSTNDIQQIQSVLVMLLRMALMAPMIGVGAVWKAYHLAPSMSWIMALSVGILFCVIISLFIVIIPKFEKLQKLVDRLNLITREILSGLRVIRAFNTQKQEAKRFDETNVDLTKLNLFINRLMTVTQPIMMLILNATGVLVIWVGGHYIDASQLPIGNMIAFMQYASQVIMSFLFFTIIFIMLPRATVSAGRIAEVIDTEPIINDPARPRRATQKHGRVEFKNVFFAYPGADVPVLENITFSAEPGQTTALIGSTGSGKSTIVNLIPRLYDTTSGTIDVDGINTRDYDQESLRAKIGLVPQKGVLFSGTVESNIKYGRPSATKDEVEAAARVAQASEFINKLPQKYLDPIAQGGSNVSGGQKQRLAIARALIAKPEIYIFDDSFSALDFKTDAKLRKALRPHIKNKTAIIVAQRVATIMEADKIIVLNEGRIVAQGTHRQLMADSQVYREIALSQLSAEELGYENLKTKPEAA